MNNAFMQSAEKAQREQSSIQKGKETGEVKGIYLRIPKELHRKVSLHRVETGESMTQLVTRLLREELE